MCVLTTLICLNVIRSSTDLLKVEIIDNVRFCRQRDAIRLNKSTKKIIMALLEKIEVTFTGFHFNNSYRQNGILSNRYCSTLQLK